MTRSTFASILTAPKQISILGRGETTSYSGSRVPSRLTVRHSNFQGNALHLARHAPPLSHRHSRHWYHRNLSTQMVSSSTSSSLAAVDMRPKGSPLNADPSQLSVLSYNLLAPLYVRPIDARTGNVQAFAAFAWAEPAAEVLDWPARHPRLLAEVRGAEADVVCLQEVQFEPDPASDGHYRFPAWLAALEDQYTVRIPSQEDLREMANRNLRVLGTAAPVGNALLFKHTRLEALEPPPLTRSQEKAVRDAATRVSALLRGRADSALAGMPATAVFSVHLDATKEAQRVSQVTKCLAHTRQLGTRTAVIAGDMNTELASGTCVAAMLAGTPPPSDEDLATECSKALRLKPEEPTSDDDTDMPESSPADPSDALPTTAQLQEWEELWSAASGAAAASRVQLQRVQTGPTRAAHEHGKDEGPCVSWSLDHIFYSDRALRCTARWQTLESDARSEAAGLPNHWCPSDHLPVACTFEIREAEALGEEARNALKQQWASMETKHQAELAHLEAGLEAQEQEMAAKYLPQPAPGEDDGKKRKKKGKPPPEMIEFLRGKREQTKALNARHAEEKSELLSGLSEVEMDAMEDMGLV